MSNLSQFRRPPDCETNSGPPEYDAELLITTLRRKDLIEIGLLWHAVA